MVRFFIVEDEKLIREGLCAHFDWAGMGAEVVGAAPDGEQGLQNILRLAPDAVIADVVMPHRNGLDMVAALREAGWDGEVIFLSAYREVEYLKRAFKYRTVDYVFKPIENEELRATVQGVVRRVLDREEAQRSMRGMERAADIANLAALIRGEVPQALPSVRAGAWCVLAFALAEGEKPIVVDIPCAIWVFHTIAGDDRAVLALPGELPEQALATIRIALQTRWGERLKKYAFGCIVRDVTELRRTALDAQNKLAMYGIKAAGEREAYLRGRWEEVLAGALLQGGGRLDAPFEDWWRALSGAVISFADMRSIANVLCNAISDYVKTEENRKAVWALLVSTLKSVAACEGAEQLHGVVRQYLDMLSHLAQKDGSDAQARRALEALVRETMREAGIEALARRMNMSRSNFIRHVKKLTGMTVNGYIAHARLCEACRLLKETDEPVYRVAEQVGYSDLKHFTQRFREQVGALPGEYRNRCRGESP